MTFAPDPLSFSQSPTIMAQAQPPTFTTGDEKMQLIYKIIEHGKTYRKKKHYLTSPIAFYTISWGIKGTYKVRLRVEFCANSNRPKVEYMTPGCGFPTPVIMSKPLGKDHTELVRMLAREVYEIRKKTQSPGCG